ncbi:glycohydrolase toxin TNT-related protein [Kutzneria sp. NPDC051319]|uniref:TNT domain-containing protein n=1 Tax=Kutzneria sp. NPDC051319 TaxID=3155047 RepID=UPI003426C3B9
MSQPTPLNPVEQDALVKQIGLALMKAAPQDWEQVRAYYRAAGRYFELSAEVTDQDGQSRAWTAPADIASLFARLRAGMYREGRGTWFNARYQLDRPSSYNLDFDRDEPQWQNPPPLMAYTDEMRFFPRTDDNVPEWLAGRLQPAGPPRSPMPPPPQNGPGPQPGRLRTARIFDGPGPDGRPTVNRPPLDPAEVGKVLDYLEAAPVVMTAQGMDSDRLAHENPESIPFAFHTDGTWIWPAAVIFYLARYGVPPEPDLVQHIRSVNFLAPDVDEATRGQAVALLSTMVPNGRPVPAAQPPATQMMSVPEPPAPEPEPEPEPLVVEQHIAPEPEPEPVVEQHAEPEPEPEPVGGASIELLRDLLDELNVPSSVYRIGEPSPNTWYLERVEDGWQVGWYEHGFSTPMLFDDDNDAAAFLLGKLLLNRPTPADEQHVDQHAEPFDGGDHGAHFEPEPEPVDIAPLPVPMPPDPGQPDLDLLPRGQSDLPPMDRPPLDLPSRPEPMDRPVHAEAMDLPPRPDPMDLPPRPEPMDLPSRAEHREPMDLPPRPEPMDLPSRAEAMDLPPRGLSEPQPDLPPLDLPPRAEPSRNEQATRLEQRPDPGLPPMTPPRPMPAQPPSPMPPPLGLPAMGGDRPPMPGQNQPPMGQPQNGQPQNGLPQQNGQAPQNGQAQRGDDWPIQPLRGEPPLTLFRGKRVIELPQGVEVDRFGQPDGNLTYAGGTPFPLRSLVPEWIGRPYHVYRLQQPVQALAGVAVPWFGQPGGGTAYLLPKSIDELLADGTLVEVRQGTPPPTGQ